MCFLLLNRKAYVCVSSSCMSLIFGTPCVGRAHFTSVPRFPSQVSFRGSSRHTSLLKDTDRASHHSPPQLPSETQQNNNNKVLPTGDGSQLQHVISCQIGIFSFFFPLSPFSPFFPPFLSFFPPPSTNNSSTPPPQQHCQHFFPLYSHTSSPPPLTQH